MSPTSYQTAPSRDIKFSFLIPTGAVFQTYLSFEMTFSHFSLGRVSRDIKFSFLIPTGAVYQTYLSSNKTFSLIFLGRVSRDKFSYNPLLNAKKQKSIPVAFYLKMSHTYNKCMYGRRI